MATNFLLFFFFFITFSLFPHYSIQFLPSSQYEALSRIKQQLNFPQELTTWSENSDFCNSEPNQILTLSCYEDNITQLHLTGNNAFPKLSQDFSTSLLFSKLASLPNLKVLTLVSLGLNGPLPSLVGNLSSLEILNISSNSFNGTIPFELSSLKNLQTLIMDHNSFTGEIPDWFSSSFKGLTVMSVRNNSLTGLIPNVLSSLKGLRSLVLSKNNLSGEVNMLQNLSNLQVLDLEENNLGPKFPILPKKLVSLVLRKNSFHSAISDELSSCFQLQKLDVSMNQLIGTFPSSIFELPSLVYLDIGGNKFTGKFLKNMSCNAALVLVNLTDNRLTGDLPDCLKSSARSLMYNGNCFKSRYYKKQHPEAFCHSEALAVTISSSQEHEKGHNSNGKVVLASSMIGGVLGAFTLVGFAFLFVKKEFCKKYVHVPHTKLIVDKVSPANTLRLLKDARYISETMKLGALGIPVYRTFVVHELKEATNNFNASNRLGDGSYGQVHKGKLTDGTVVAVRSLKAKRKHYTQTYTHQLELISKLRHCHLVSAIGHCFECFQDDLTVSQIFLVFEYVPNGNLRRFISEGEPGERFGWTKRIGAAIGVAKGILFLHTGTVPGVYSNNLKITDILLDNDLHVKISKYNIPLLTENRKSSEVGVPLSHGSKETGGLMLRNGEKNDVYDLGVILLELIAGRKIASENDVHVSKDILSASFTSDEVARRNVVDPAIQKECSDESLKTLIELCIRCLSNEPTERPTIEDVIWNLQFAAQVQDSWLLDSNSRENSPFHHP